MSSEIPTQQQVSTSGMQAQETREASCACGGSMVQTALHYGGERPLWVPTQCHDCEAAATAKAERHQRQRQQEEVQRLLDASGLPQAYRTRMRTRRLYHCGGTPGMASAECAARDHADCGRFSTQRVDHDSPFVRSLDRESIPESARAASEALRTALKSASRLAEGQLRMVTGERPRPGLWLQGCAGSFKTTIAAGLLQRHITETRRPGSYKFWPELVGEIFASYGSEATTSAEAIISGFAEAPALVLDDVRAVVSGRGGAPKLTYHAAQVLFKILDRLYRRTLGAADWQPVRWVIITSNQSIEGLCDTIEDADLREPIYRRLSEMMVRVAMDPPAGRREVAA